uniref:DC STAMP domain containing protein 2 n=1 Tax=Echinococcus granulosus TaxID=6210 RepID=A0A068WJP9_ECHGR|nr:DC STAMP domain containing protein 2 [Echinococcus granulosus]
MSNPQITGPGKRNVCQGPQWLSRFEKIFDAFLSEEPEDDIENPSLCRRLNLTYMCNFQRNQANNMVPAQKKLPSKKKKPKKGSLTSGVVNNNTSRKIKICKSVDRNASNLSKEPRNFDTCGSKLEPNLEGEKPEENVDEALIQELEARKEINKILLKLEKPSCCERFMSRLQRLCDKTCCKYTPRIYFKKPLSWYSATSKLDAGTLLRENYLGITAGIIIGFASFPFFSTAFAHMPHMAALAACYMMMLTVFGIAFSSDFRCILLITLPYLVASRTRWLLMLIATTLATTGPALNFMHNSGNFRNAIACVLGQVSANVELMGKITKAPLKIIVKQLSGFIDNINNRLFAARMSLRKLKEVIFMATKILNQKSDWIRAMVEACGDEIAMKNQCLAFFNTLYFNCAASMKSMSFLCNLVRMFADQACNGVAKLNDICVRESNRLHSEMTNVVPVSEEQLEDSEDSILRFLGHENISVEVGEEMTDISFGMNVSSQTVVTTVIEEKMDLMMNGLNYFKRAMAWVLTIWTLFTVIQLIVQAAMYRKKWLKKPFFDNGHITPQFVAQERRALEHGRPTALPLTHSERMNYVTLTACQWSKTERNAAVGSLVFLFVGIITLVLIIFADYAMYQVVLTTSPAFSTGFGEVQQTLEEGISDQISDFGFGASEQVVPEIQGNSTMSEIGRSFMNLANPLKDIAFSVDATICRPRPSEPDHETTILIGLALVLTLLSIIVQVYVLRLRHLILAWYYPDGANRRAAWLRTYIRNTRGLFHQFIHKLFNRKLKKSDAESSGGKLKKLDRFIFLHPQLARYFAMAGIKRVFCAQCTAPGNPKKKVEFHQNFTQCPRCGVYYCKLCQVNLGGICMYCNVPVNTLSNEVDFEIWSSDEEYDYFYDSGKLSKPPLLYCKQRRRIVKSKFNSQVSDSNPQTETGLDERDAAGQLESVNIKSRGIFTSSLNEATKKPSSIRNLSPSVSDQGHVGRPNLQSFIFQKGARGGIQLTDFRTTSAQESPSSSSISKLSISVESLSEKNSTETLTDIRTELSSLANAKSLSHQSQRVKNFTSNISTVSSSKAQSTVIKKLSPIKEDNSSESSNGTKNPLSSFKKIDLVSQPSQSTTTPASDISTMSSLTVQLNYNEKKRVLDKLAKSPSITDNEDATSQTVATNSEKPMLKKCKVKRNISIGSLVDVDYKNLPICAKAAKKITTKQIETPCYSLSQLGLSIGGSSVLVRNSDQLKNPFQDSELTKNTMTANIGSLSSLSSGEPGDLSPLTPPLKIAKTDNSGPSNVESFKNTSKFVKTSADLRQTISETSNSDTFFSWKNNWNSFPEVQVQRQKLARLSSSEVCALNAIPESTLVTHSASTSYKMLPVSKEKTTLGSSTGIAKSVRGKLEGVEGLTDVNASHGSLIACSPQAKIKLTSIKTTPSKAHSQKSRKKYAGTEFSKASRSTVDCGSRAFNNSFTESGRCRPSRQPWIEGHNNAKLENTDFKTDLADNPSGDYQSPRPVNTAQIIHISKMDSEFKEDREKEVKEGMNSLLQSAGIDQNAIVQAIRTAQENPTISSLDSISSSTSNHYKMSQLSSLSMRAGHEDANEEMTTTVGSLTSLEASPDTMTKMEVSELGDAKDKSLIELDPQLKFMESRFSDNCNSRSEETSISLAKSYLVGINKMKLPKKGKTYFTDDESTLNLPYEDMHYMQPDPELLGLSRMDEPVEGDDLEISDFVTSSTLGSVSALRFSSGNSGLMDFDMRIDDRSRSYLDCKRKIRSHKKQK